MLTLEQAGCVITHHFAPHVYAKQVTIPAGTTLLQHKHTFDHMSILASGLARVEVNGRRMTFSGPSVINILAGEHHTVEAITECEWFCIHHTDETDPKKIDATVIAGD